MRPLGSDLMIHHLIECPDRHQLVETISMFRGYAYAIGLVTKRYINKTWFH